MPGFSSQTLRLHESALDEAEKVLASLPDASAHAGTISNIKLSKRMLSIGHVRQAITMYRDIQNILPDMDKTHPALARAISMARATTRL